MMNETLDELKTRLAALNLPDVTADELITLVREPLAHVSFQQEGGLVRVWTHACCFVLDLASLRTSVAIPETLGLMQARPIVAESAVFQPVKRRTRRVLRERDEALQAPPAKGAEIAEGLGKDVQENQGGES